MIDILEECYKEGMKKEHINKFISLMEGDNMNKEEMIKELSGEYIKVNSEWVKENDIYLYDFLKDKLEGFVRSKDNNASQEDLDSFVEGNYQVEVYFDESGMSYSAGRNLQNVSNQPDWGMDRYEDIPEEELKIYYNKIFVE